MSEFFIQQNPSRQRLAEAMAYQQPRQSQQPSLPLGMAGKFAGGGSASTGAGASAGTSAGGGASSSLANPWVALAALIATNEMTARNSGDRDSNPWKHAQDALIGKVVEQDMNKWAPKIFGDDKYGFGGDMRVFGDLSTHDFSNAWDHLKNNSTLSKTLGKLF